MSDSKLCTQSMDFAVSIIQLVKQLKAKRESIISKPDRPIRDFHRRKYPRSTVRPRKGGFYRQIADRFERSK